MWDYRICNGRGQVIYFIKAFEIDILTLRIYVLGKDKFLIVYQND